MGLKILDTTIRDGSYAIDFQFSAEDTALIAAGLEKSGFRLIEVGHGLGLNASNAGKGKAAASDEDYLRATSRVLTKAQFGMFFIPGIGRKEDLKLAANYGMDFVRIGTNVTEVEDSEEYVALAKKLGFMVTLNLMKSYALPLNEFLQKAKLVEKYGVDVIYLVDSAGGMFPDDIHEYITSLKETTDCEIGFHGHDNLNLALANTLEAIKCGATYVDSSLQGMGRSAGNAQTEVLLLVLDKLGYQLDIDFIKTMDLGERLIKPLMRERHGVDSIAMVSGVSQFHSSFLSDVYKAASRYNIDPRELIMGVSEKEKINVTEKLAVETAEEIYRERIRLQSESISLTEVKFDFSAEDTKVSSELKNRAAVIADDIASLSLKKGKESVFIIAVASDPKSKPSIFPFIQEDLLYVVGNAEINCVEHLEEIVPELNGKIRTIIVDAEQKGEIRQNLPELAEKLAPDSRVLTYKDNDLWVEAVDGLLARSCRVYGQNITIVGANNLGFKLALKLLERGGRVTVSPHGSKRDVSSIIDALAEMSVQGVAEMRLIEDIPEAAAGAEILIGMTPGSPSVTKEMIAAVKPESMILDAGPGTVTDEAVTLAHEKGIKLVRIDMQPVIMGKVHELLHIDHHASSVMGKKSFEGFDIVAGGMIGKRGDVVVDSVSNPSKVIGVADGKGRVLYGNKKYQSRVDKVRDHIYQKKLADIFGNPPTNDKVS